jgi:hypothetical protein
VLAEQVRPIIERAIAEVVQAATEAQERALQRAVADVSQQAELQLAQIRESAQKHTDELQRSTEAQITELKRAVEDGRRNAQAEIDDAHRLAQTQVDDVQRIMDERLAELRRQLAVVEHRLSSVVSEDPVRELAEGIVRLDGAKSLSDVLDTIIEVAAGHADRTAVLVVRGEQFVGWRLSGFGDRGASPRSLSIGPSTAGVVQRAVASGAPVTLNAADTSASADVPLFARNAGMRDHSALPLIVGGTAVAVVYADAVAGEPTRAARRTAALDLLARHASKVLEAITVQQALGLSTSRPVARPSHNVGSPRDNRSS